MKKGNKWIKWRHTLFRNIAYAIVYPITKLKYNVKLEKRKDLKQCLILYNHQTPFDQFFVAFTFPNTVYYLATEDIFSLGFLSTLLRYCFAPIPIKKQTTDVRAVMNCLKIAKEGGTIAMAPEGNRTYSGKTEYINPAIISFSRKLKLPIALFRIEGGYGMEPRWSSVTRKGQMTARVSRVLYPEDYAKMTDDELYETICKELYVNEAKADAEFYHKKSAEYLERLVFVCEKCGLSTFESKNDIVRCKKCDRKIRYMPNKRLEGVNCKTEFGFVNDWYEYQKDFVNNLDVTQLSTEPLFVDTASIYNVVLYKNKSLVKKSAEISLYGDRVVLDDQTLFFKDVSSVVALGRNKTNIYHGESVYQLKGSKRFNAIKYVFIYHRFKNLLKGEPDKKFLGL